MIPNIIFKEQKVAFLYVTAIAVRLKSLTIYQTHCPSGRAVLNSVQVRYGALSPHRPGNGSSGPLAPASLCQLRNFQPSINFRGSVGMIKTQSCFVFNSASYVKPLRSLWC